jgi:hypothetical protein
MSRHENTQMTASMRHELETVDAVLRGETVPAEQLPLAELARTLRALRPRPTDELVRSLDAKAARGFARENGTAGARGAGASRRGTRDRRARRLRLLPAAGLGLAVLITAVVLTGQSGSRRAPVPQPAARSAPAEARGPLAPLAQGTDKAANAGRAEAAPAEAGPAAPARQIERTSTLEVGVAPNAVESAAQRTFTIVSAYRGYVRQSNVSSSTTGGGGASFDIRVPSANLAGAIAALSHLGHVRSENDTTNDVTDQLGALERRLGELQAERASLLGRLERATESQEIAALKSRIHAVDGGIAAQQGALRTLRSRVDYVSLALSLTPEAAAPTGSGSLTPGAAARDAGEVLETALAVLVIAAAVLLPVGAIGIAAWASFAFARRRLREQALDASA